MQFSYNLLNLPAQIKSGSTVKANYTYLSDGTKAAAYTSASAGKDYVGSFVYSRGSGGTRTLESVAFGGKEEQDEKASSAFLQEVPVPYNLIDHQCANVVKKAIACFRTSRNSFLREKK